MAGTDNSIINGIYKSTDVQDRIRKYAQDKDYFRFWALRQRNNISVLKVISEKFGTVPGEVVADWKFRYPEFDEIDYQFYVQTNTTGVHNILIVTNEIASILNTSTRLNVQGSFVNKAGTAMLDHIDLSNGVAIPEELRIVHVDNEDSGGAGKTKVTVRRGHPNLSATPIAITTSMQLTVSNLVARTNDRPKEPVSKNSKYLENNIQITRHSYGLGEHMTQGGGIDTYLAKGSEEYFNIMYTLAETYLMKAIERAILVARQDSTTVNGNEELETGGIYEFILNDSDHILDFNGLVPTVRRINNFIRRMADTSGVKELWMFTGTEMAEQLANAYESKSMYTTEAALSVKYNLIVKQIESTGRDLTVYHVVAPILNELGMANEALILNLSEMNYNEKHPFGCFQIAYKVPFTDHPDNADSYEQNSGFKGKWRELYGAWGLVRRLQETHFRWVNAAPAS